MPRIRSWILDHYKIIYDQPHARAGKAYCIHCPVLDSSLPFVTSKSYVYPNTAYVNYSDHLQKHHADMYEHVKPPMKSIARSVSTSTASSSSLSALTRKRANENGEMPVKKRQTGRKQLHSIHHFVIHIITSYEILSVVCSYFWFHVGDWLVFPGEFRLKLDFSYGHIDTNKLSHIIKSTIGPHSTVNGDHGNVVVSSEECLWCEWFRIPKNCKSTQSTKPNQEIQLCKLPQSCAVPWHSTYHQSNF